MPVPVTDPNYAAEGKALLTSRYINQKVTAGIVAALMARLQVYENAFQGLLFDIILANHPLPGGPWDVLDKLGAIVGEPRMGRSDADYVPAIRLRVRVNRSRGLVEDVIQVAALALPGQVPIYVEFGPGFPASWRILVFNIPSPNVVAILLSQTRSAGTYGTLAYTTWPIGNPNVILLPSSYAPGTISPLTGLADSYNRAVTPGGALCAETTC